MLNEMRGFFYVYINQYFINEHSSISGAKRRGKLFKFIAWYYGAVEGHRKILKWKLSSSKTCYLYYEYRRLNSCIFPQIAFHSLKIKRGKYHYEYTDSIDYYYFLYSSSSGLVFN